VQQVYALVTSRRRFFTPAFTVSKKLNSLLSSVRHIIRTRGHSCADPRPSRRLGVNSVGSLFHADVRQSPRWADRLSIEPIVWGSQRLANNRGFMNQYPVRVTMVTPARSHRSKTPRCPQCKLRQSRPASACPNNAHKRCTCCDHCRRDCALDAKGSQLKRS